MFDLSRLTDVALDRVSNATPAVQPELVDLLRTAGLDPSLLDGMNPSDVSHLLAEFGIDPGALDFSALTDMSGGGILGALQDAMGQRDL